MSGVPSFFNGPFDLFSLNLLSGVPSAFRCFEETVVDLTEGLFTLDFSDVI